MPATATEIAAAVRAGTTTATAQAEAALERIAAGDVSIRAFQRVRTARARAEAAAVDGRADRFALPLAGVPVAVKDNVPIDGEPLRIGSAATSAQRSPRDHEVVRRLRRAGAVIVGVTNVPELCVFGTTDSAAGITRNPWDPGRSAGGSSGGSAAAVAAGLVPVAHGNDGMGSIRIPAACCGLVGIKPGLGVVPSDLGNGSWFDMAENGPLATTVADAALLLSVLAADPSLGVDHDPPALRLAVTTAAPGPGIRVDPDFVTATVRAAGVLRAAGHTVTRTTPPAPLGASASQLARWVAGTELDARLLPDRAALQPRTRRHAAIGARVLRAGYPRASGRAAWQRTAQRFFADHDVLITPALAAPPPRAAAWSRRGWAANVLSNMRYAPFAAAWNLAGWPAMVVPAGRHRTGLPAAVQLVAPPGGEATLIGLAAQLEALAPWPRTARG